MDIIRNIIKNMVQIKNAYGETPRGYETKKGGRKS